MDTAGHWAKAVEWRGGIAIHPFADYGSKAKRADAQGETWADYARQRRDAMPLTETLQLGKHLR